MLRSFIPETATAYGNQFGLAPLTDAHRARVDLFAKYWQYYRGHHKKQLKRPEGQADDNVIVNWSRKIVDAGVQFLFGKGATFEIEEGSARTPAETYLDTIWQDDPARRWSVAQFLQALAQNGAICGTAVVRLYPPAENGQKPTLKNIDPAIVDIITNADDSDDVTGYHLLWKSGQDWKRHRIERDESDLWVIREEIRRGGVWELQDEQAWEWDFSPVFHCQNLILANSVWGASDLEDADLNDAVNFANSNINRILRFHAHPRTIGIGFNAAQLTTTAVDQFWTIANPEAQVFNLEMQSDLASSQMHKAQLEEAYHQITNVPRLDPAQVNLGALSGFALRILYGPLLAKTAVKQQTYGAMLAQINRALLILGGHDDELVINRWPSPLPESALEKAQLLQALTAAGASLEGAAKVAGYDDRQIEDLRPKAAESRPSMPVT
jgi:hypothetical protein